jgi:hypothetical protein
VQLTAFGGHAPAGGEPLGSLLRLRPAERSSGRYSRAGERHLAVTGGGFEADASGAAAPAAPSWPKVAACLPAGLRCRPRGVADAGVHQPCPRGSEGLPERRRPGSVRAGWREARAMDGRIGRVHGSRGKALAMATALTRNAGTPPGNGRAAS